MDNLLVQLNLIYAEIYSQLTKDQQERLINIVYQLEEKNVALRRTGIKI